MRPDELAEQIRAMVDAAPPVDVHTVTRDRAAAGTQPAHRARGGRRLALGLAAAAVALLAGTAVVASRTADDDLGVATADRRGPASTLRADPAPDGGEDAPPDVGTQAPPPVVVSGGGRSVELDAVSYCYGGACVDGVPPAEPTDVGESDMLTVEFLLPDWDFTASFTAVGDDCSRVQEVPLESQGDGTFTLRPAGHAGTYEVHLFGRGNGDVSVLFTWTTTSDGPLPVPEARLALLAGPDGEIDSYGVELAIENLARTPSEASATITVTAPNGRSLTFDAARETLGCTEGSLYWGGPDEQGLAAAQLDDEGPFVYEVVVLLDGVRHVATATWPDDQIVGNEPSVALDFQPALPAMT
jgi:hypothetical protein